MSSPPLTASSAPGIRPFSKSYAEQNIWQPHFFSMRYFLRHDHDDDEYSKCGSDPHPFSSKNFVITLSSGVSIEITACPVESARIKP